MIWVAVFPTLTVLNLAIGDRLDSLNPVLRTFVLATVAIPIVIYGLMPQLPRLRVHLLTRAPRSGHFRHTPIDQSRRCGPQARPPSCRP
jgi:antibiotic biosynthesis monooxygenase (ABM) superfamily enzyme